MSHKSDLKINDKVEFAFLGKKMQGTVLEIDGDICVVSFDESARISEFKISNTTFIMQPTYFIKVKAPKYCFTKI